MANTFTYDLGRAVYVNLTNQCTCDCTFCVRREGEGVGPYELWLEREPSAEEVISELAKTKPQHVVFCGFGEPTMKLDVLLETAKYVKSYGGHTRIDTNGHGSLYNGRDIVPELRDCIDEVSVSLNAPDAHKYAELTQCRYGEEGWDALLTFARRAREEGIGVTLTVVDCIRAEDIAASKKIADRLGVKFRVRTYVP